MPVSNKIEAQIKTVNFNIRGRSAIQTEFQDESKFLTIAPALPVLPGTLTPLKLSKRSYHSLSTVGSSFNLESPEVESSNAVTLQWMGEGKTISAIRAPAEKEKNPDRISLDRRGLTVFPNIIGESKLRLISLQHNLLTKIEGCNFEQLNKLVFLDLYDNQIEKICSLECLENLRVFLMGKNRIKKIEGLMQLCKLEVLDLHGNQIQQIAGLNGLSSLKVLNLAGNIIKIVGCNDFHGLTSLKELNLRRNRIKKLLGFGDIPQLQKLYLSNNDIYKVEDMGSIVKAFHIKEISIDGNPITLNSDYISFLVSYLPNLQILSSMQITEQIRRTAIAWRTAKEQVNSAFLDLSTQVCMNVQREEIISNAKTNWEFLRSKSKPTTNDNKINNCKINNSNSMHNKVNIIRPKSLSKARLKGFGSLTSINEKVEATKIQINKRSNSTDSLHKLEDTSKTYPLEFKLPPILSSIIDNLMNNKFNENLLKLGNSLGTLNDATSSANSETESSESHESLKSGLRCHLIHSSRRTSSVDSEKYSGHNKIDVKKDGDLSSTSKTLINMTNHVAESSVYKNHKTTIQFIDDNIESNIKLEDSSTKSYHEDGISEANISNDCETIQTESNSNRVKYYSINSKINSLDSSKSTLSDSSSLSLSKNITHKNNDFEKDKHRVKSAHVKKIVYYKSNRAATARVKYRAAVSTSPRPQQILPREREQGSDYLIEIIGRCLNVFGQGALRFIDRSWDTLKAEDVNVVKFNYVQFNSIALILNKLKNRFPNVEHFLFKETNISHLGQINALAEAQGLGSIRIEAEGNPIISKNWRSYAIFRLAHWGLHTINGKEITEEEIEHADEEYAGLIDIVIQSLPDSLLQPLLQRLHLEKVQRQNGEQITAKQFLFNSDPALRSVVGKEALQWRKGNVTQEDLIWRHKGKVHLLNLIDLTVDAIEKLQILENEWPSILNKIICQALSDFSDMDKYMKKCSKMLDIDKLFINNT
ncbi:leucine-rich repeat-containing protein 49 isoform X2 [Polistes fuscatus]|uniref:leucine-rich repeat-containing protein 49 isoform X2 n=1 Tax=Polistes fuscatus TaxID=30207 RepID=UPI001CA8DC8D|nr:leucine-rich repeat-containing protein 49 isoform X2 [Polistes fuscatus]